MSDDAPRPIGASDLLAAAAPALNSHRSPRRSPASTSSRARDAVIKCERCRDGGQLLETELAATDAGLLILDWHTRFDGRRFAYVPCDCAAGLARIAAWQQLPPDAEGVALESLFDVPEQDQALMATEAFCANPVGWLSFGGNYGVGKTALLYAALNRLAVAGRYGRYITAPELVDKLRNLIRAGGDPDRYLDRWCDAPLIAIDELDKYDPTEFADKSIFRLFNARYQRWQTTGTLIAYNLDREDRLPPFLRSRIHDGRFRFVRLAGADVRPGLGGDAWETGETYA